MAEFDEKGLKAHIKGGEFFPMYLICGDEDYLKKHYRDTLASKNVDAAFEGFNLEYFEGKSVTLDTVFQAATVMPMMSGKRCIIVEDYKLESLSEGELSLMEEFFSDAPDTALIIFYQRKKDFSLQKARKVCELFRKQGALCCLNKRTGADLIKPLMASASRQGCSLSSDTAKYLVALSGDDLNTLINEINKLCSYVGQGEITRGDIDALAIKTDDAKVYALTRALSQKNFDEAYRVLHSLIRQRLEPEYIMGTLISSYADMYRAKVALICGEKADALSSDFSYGKRAFALTNAGRDSSKTDISLIRACLEELARADRQLKTGTAQPTVVLEQLMVRLFLVLGGEKI